MAPQELVLVFESPHVDELKARLPVVGTAGKSALRFLLSDQPRDLSLGRFVQQSHLAGDGRIAILNVSNVPMQAAAFAENEGPDLTWEEWALIEKVRRSRARSVSSMRSRDPRRLRGPRRRFALSAFGVHRWLRGSSGRCRYFRAKDGCRCSARGPSPRPLNVPHPSFNHWNRLGNENSPGLLDTRRRFESNNSMPRTGRGRSRG